MSTAKTKRKTSAEKLRILRQLPPLSRLIIQILAMNYEPLSRQRLLNYLKKVAPYQANLKLPTSNQALAPHLKPLQKFRLATTVPGRGLSCNHCWRHQAIITAQEDKSFTKTAMVLVAADENHWHYGRFSSYDAALRQVLLAAYGALPAKGEWQLANLLENIERQFGNVGRQPPLLTLFANPFEAEIMARLPEDIQFSILYEALLIPAAGLDPINEKILAYASNLDHFPPPKHAQTCHLLATVQLWRGRTTAAAAMLRRIEAERGYGFPELVGWLAFLRGKDDLALENFRRHLEIARKNTGKRKVTMNDYPGFFYLCALLRRGRTADLEEGLKYLATAGRKSRRDYGAKLYQDLQPFFREKLRGSDPDTVAGKREQFTSFYDFFAYTLLELAISAWQGNRHPPEVLHYLEKIASRAVDNGYCWHAAQAAELLAGFGVDEEENRRLAAALREQHGFQTLTNLVIQDEPWRRKLQALASLGHQEKTREEKAGRERLVWLLTYDQKEETLEIRPRLQKRSQRGGWSRGRSISLQKLATNREELSFLTSQDIRVCEAIHLYQETDSYYYYRKNYYDFDLGQALPALVGHPLLFTAGDNGKQLEPVELTAGQIEINIRFRQRRNGPREIFLTMNPRPDPGDDLHPQAKVVPTGKNSFRLFHFTREHLQIARLLGDGLAAPAEAMELVRQAVAGLTSRVTVHSEVEMGGDLPVVPGDPTPHLRLRPYGGGLKVELLVRPLPSGPSYFFPGRGGGTFLAEYEGRRVQVERQLPEEKTAAAALVQACPTLDNLDDGSGNWLIENPETCLELLAELQELTMDKVIEWPQGETMRVGGRASVANLYLQVKQSGNWLQTDGSLKIDEQQVIKLEKLLQGLDDSRSQGRFIPLDDGSFLALSRNLHERLRELASLAAPAGKKIKVNPLAAISLADLFNQAAEVKGDHHWQQQQARLREAIRPVLPSTFQGQLRPYQLEGFNWLARLSHWGVGACLADDMGLGKTIQALAAILLRAPKGPSLVVCPLSVLANWEEEAARFTPTLRTTIFGGSDRQGLLDRLEPFDLVLCSYGLLQINREMLTEVDWQTVVLDEAQAIKNPGAKRTQAAMKLRAEFRLITTGTPVENHLGELWTLFHFLNPGLLGSLKTFQQRFAVPIEKKHDLETGKRLRKLIRPFILRRRKAQVLRELPAKTEITLRIAMDPKEVVLYEAQRRQALERLAGLESGNGRRGQQHLHILAEIMKLRRLCCNPRLLLPDTDIASAKLLTFAELLAELLASSHKVLVFSQFVDHLQLIREYLDREKISYQYLDGATPAGERRRRVEAFQGGSGDVFLISLKAGGTGLNLTAADYVIHLDPWWNPAVEDQASDRAHRIGQQRPVTVYRLVMKGTIEERIIDLHREKRDLADNLLAGSEMSGKIAAEELLQLLQTSYNAN